MTLQGIAYKTKKRGEMIPCSSANITLEKGVENDVFGKPTKRQVTVMSTEQWQLACNVIGKDLPWLTRRANLLVSGYQFSAADVGKTIYIGDNVKLQITGETDPCSKMEQAHQGLEQALLPDWRGGVTCKVISAGMVNKNDTVEIR